MQRNWEFKEYKAEFGSLVHFLNREGKTKIMEKSGNSKDGAALIFLGILQSASRKSKGILLNLNRGRGGNLGWNLGVGFGSWVVGAERIPKLSYGKMLFS